VLINYFSDIHLEFGPLNVPKNAGDIIIAAGDIGIYNQGLEWLMRMRKPAIYVAGNHEFYEHEYADTLAMLRERSKGTNVHFLEKDAVVINGIRFIGCTLWTALGGDDDVMNLALQRSLNDFRKIRFGDRLFDEEDFMDLHILSRDWLVQELEKPFSGQTVVVTHHAPTFWSWQQEPESRVRYAYCNDLKSIMHVHDIAAWFHGHTHWASDYTCAGTRVLCNPRGYDGRQLVEGFNPAKLANP